MEHSHSVVVLGLTNDTEHIRLVNLFQVPRSSGVNNIEHDLNILIAKLRAYQPDKIFADSGFAGNYNDKLHALFGDTFYSVVVRSARTNNDYNAHYNEVGNTVTIDKLTQNVLTLSAIKRGDFLFYKPVDNNLKLFMQHWENVAIRTDEVQDPVTHLLTYQKVITRKGGDHYAQACVYAYVAMRRVLADLTKDASNQLCASYLSDDLSNMQDTPTDLSQELNDLI